MNLIKNKKFVLFVAACLLVYVVFLVLIFFGGRVQTLSNRFGKINPGKTSEQDAVSAYGKPAATEKSGGNNTLLYNSSFLYQYDRVFTKDGTVIATLVALPADTTIKQATSELGPAESVLYDTNLPDDTWFAYYKKGIAVKAAGDMAFYVLRFTPQTKEAFFTNIAPIVGIVEQKIKQEGEPL